MSDSPSPSGNPRWSPRILWRWLLRFLGWSALVMLAGLVLTVVVSLLAYFNRVSLINDALANYVEPFDVTVSEIDFLPLGTVSISGLELRPREVEVDAPLLAVPKVALTYRFQELRNTGKFRSVTFERPSIRLSEETLRALRSARRSPSSSSAPIDLGTFSFFSESLEAVDGEVSLDLLNAPPLSARWDFRLDSPSFDDDRWLASPIRWELRSVAVGPEGDWGTFDRIEGDLSFRKDLTAARISALEIPESRLTITPEWLTPPAETSAPDGPSGSPPTESPSSFDLAIGRFDLGKTLVEIRDFDGKDDLPAIPDARFETQLSLTGITSTQGRWDSESPLHIEISNLGIGTEEEPLSFSEIVTLTADSLGAAIHDQRIDRLEIIGWDLVLNESTVEKLPLADYRKAAPEPSTSATAPAASPWEIGEVEIVGGHLLTDDLSLSGTPLPSIETLFEASLEDLSLGGRMGLESDALQQVNFEQSRLWAPGVEHSKTAPILSWQRAEITGRWSEFTKSNRIQGLTLRGPQIHFTDESLGTWIEPPRPSPERPGPINLPVYQVADLLVTGGHLVADSSFAEKIVPKVVSEFRIETAREPEVSPFTYDIILNQLELRNHAVFLEALNTELPEAAVVAKSPNRPVNEQSVLQMEQLALRATASGLQREREIESLVISGARLTVGEGLRAIVEKTAPSEPEPDLGEGHPAKTRENSPQSPTAPAEEKAPGAPAAGAPASDVPAEDAQESATPAPETPLDAPRDQAAAAGPVPPPPPQEERAPGKLPTWKVKRLEVAGGTVQFEALIPQIEGLQFDINTILTDVPLSPDALLAQEEIQQVELSNIEIKDPYDSFITVAELPTIFVKFSLAGLVNQEIEQVDLINPSLYVGQGLFWWIDYQRKFRAQNEGASVGLAEGGPLVEKPDWSIRELNATAGKIVVAPVGIPIGVVPFPFNATTKLENGEIELTLNIPEEEHVYRFPDYKVELTGLTGDVLFNVPVKNEDNNLVQKFFLDQINWKEYEAKDLYLVVTFDENGIYGDLGGYAYDGYVKAGFNFYLDRPGKWDAWISGTDLSTSPITRILAPENFVMEGPISINLVSEGFRKDLGETTAEIQTTGPGWFDVTKLDAILENFPDDWTGWQESLAELSLIALKRFDYDKGSGSLYLLGRDGLFSLRFAGPYGIRELNLHLHDNRNTTAGVDSGTPSEPVERLPAETAD